MFSVSDCSYLLVEPWTWVYIWYNVCHHQPPSPTTLWFTFVFDSTGQSSLSHQTVTVTAVAVDVKKSHYPVGRRHSGVRRAFQKESRLHEMSVTQMYITHTHTDIYIYGPDLRPATPQCYPPQQPPAWGSLAIYDHPSRSHMLYLHAGLVPSTHYLTGYLHAVFTTAYMAIQSIYNVLLPKKYLYSSHILATIKIV